MTVQAGEISGQDLNDKPIRPAATMLMVRDTEAGVEVLTLKRSEHMRFLPGYLAFPGGSVSLDDEVTAREHTDGSIENFEQSDDCVYAVAAVRETAEEVGWICPVSCDGRVADRSVGSQGQASFLEGVENPFGQYLARERLKIDLGRLRFVGRWVTPSYMPARFDTRFFLYLVGPHQDFDLSIHQGENEWGRWEKPQELLSRIHSKQEQAVPPTIAMLRALSEVGTTEIAWQTLKVPGPRPEDR